jgi:F420-0:gamma-glutamyl ligase
MVSQKKNERQGSINTPLLQWRDNSMQITSIKTHKITKQDTDILKVLDRYVTKFEDNSMLVLVSKVLAITQGRIIKPTKEEKDELIRKEADYYLPPEENAYHLYITMKDNILTYSSGMDESNGNGFVVLWPENPQQEANTIREYLCKRFDIRNAGVIITDMTAIPLQRGVIAGPIAHSGFLAIRDLTKEEDVFGRPFEHTKQGIVQGLAAAAGVVMGEGADQTPIASITDVPFVQFQDRNPTDEEHEALIVTPKQDLFGSLFASAPWRRER